MPASRGRWFWQRRSLSSMLMAGRVSSGVPVARVEVRMTLAAQFQIEYLQYLGPDGKPVAELPQAFRDASGPGAAVQADAVRAHLRCEGDRAAAHRQARHLRQLPRPRSHARRHRRVDAARRRLRAELPRVRRAVHARREAARSADVLGRRRTRQRFLRPEARLSVVRADRARNACTRPAPRSPSSCAARRAWP